jgi:hypothetical protein
MILEVKMQNIKLQRQVHEIRKEEDERARRMEEKHRIFEENHRISEEKHRQTEQGLRRIICQLEAVRALREVTSEGGGNRYPMGQKVQGGWQ